MTLNEYAHLIRAITTSTKLAPAEKRAALECLTEEILRCGWQPWARGRAMELAGLARDAARTYPDGGLEALDSLAHNASRAHWF